MLLYEKMAVKISKKKYLHYEIFDSIALLGAIFGVFFIENLQKEKNPKKLRCPYMAMLIFIKN